MKKLLSRCLLFLFPMALTGCQLITGLKDGGNCPARYVGEYGCVQVIVMIDTPPQPWPERYIFDLRAVPARRGTGLNDPNFAASPNAGRNRLHLARHDPPNQLTGDTASVWISARILDYPPESPTGVPLPVFAADSALYLVDFNRSRVDTVHLTLARP